MDFEDGTTHGGGRLVDAAADWLMAQALDDTDVRGLVQGICTRLVAAGIPLWRVNLAFTTLHPLVSAISVTWHRDVGLSVDGIEHSRDESPAWAISPYKHVIENGLPYLRRRLVGDDAQFDFPILTELRQKGATEYLAIATRFRPAASERRFSDGIVVSWATDRGDGFNEQDLKSILRIQRRLAVACKVAILSDTASNIATTYLGAGAGSKVLTGQIQRGAHETIHAAIWYSDMRGSTHLADTLPSAEFLALLNAYFECTAGAVMANGGEVLMFIGDAVLAIFPTDRHDGGGLDACARAVAAAGDAVARLDAANAARAEMGADPIAFGIAVHVGEVMYGNIGVPERLEFSVVGPAVNEVVRLEGLTKILRRPIL
ncbi:MAG: adenylate/guanylate cyclase domain-containing protein, partial [Rhodospirillaceae bacterium]